MGTVDFFVNFTRITFSHIAVFPPLQQCLRTMSIISAALRTQSITTMELTLHAVCLQADRVKIVRTVHSFLDNAFGISPTTSDPIHKSLSFVSDHFRWELWPRRRCLGLLLPSANPNAYSAPCTPLTTISITCPNRNQCLKEMHKYLRPAKNSIAIFAVTLEIRECCFTSGLCLSYSSRLSANRNCDCTSMDRVEISRFRVVCSLYVSFLHARKDYSGEWSKTN